MHHILYICFSHGRDRFAYNLFYLVSFLKVIDEKRKWVPNIIAPGDV